MGETAGEGHGGHMHRRHLRAEHGLNLVARLDASDHRQDEVELALVFIGAEVIPAISPA